MISTFDIRNLDILLKDFYVSVGVRISIFDDEFNLVTEYPKEAPAFCNAIRRTASGRAGCHRSDEHAMKEAKKRNGSVLYTCHAGITEAVTPIQLGGGVLGYAVLAHMLPKENYEDALSKACELAEKYGIQKEESVSATAGISVKSEREINAAVRLLDAVASYVYISNLAKWKNEDLSVRLKKYVEENLSEQLCAEDICKQFSCSRSALYHVAVQTFGCGIMQYIRLRRIEYAKRLLEEGRTIAETAEKCGFSEYSYFCKVFRSLTGCSPAEYRRQNKHT